MTQFEQIVTAVAIIGFLFVGATAAWIRLSQRVDPGDPYGLRRMRRTSPERYRVVVESARYNSIVLLCVGLALLVVGTITGATMGFWLLAIASPVGGSLLAWIGFRWSRWAWRIKLD